MEPSWKTKVTFKQISPLLGYAAVAGVLQVVAEMLVSNLTIAFGLKVASWAFLYLAVRAGIKAFKKNPPPEIQ